MGLDPRTKLLILAITSVSVFLNRSIAVECAYAGIPLLMLAMSGQPKLRESSQKRAHARCGDQIASQHEAGQKLSDIHGEHIDDPAGRHRKLGHRTQLHR